MLKKFSLSFLFLPVLLVASIPAFSQGFSYSGKVRINNDLYTNTQRVKPDAADATTRETLGFGLDYNVSSSFSYAVAIPSLSGWVVGAKFGFEVFGNTGHRGNSAGRNPTVGQLFAGTALNFALDGDYAVYMGNDLVTVNIGYIEGVSNPVGRPGPETTAIRPDNTANDTGDLIGRKPAFAISATPIDGLTAQLLVGFAVHSYKTPTGTKTTDNEIVAGGSVKYNNYGAEVGLGVGYATRGNKDQSIPNQKDSIKIAAGAGYDLSAVVADIGVPKIWLSFILANASEYDVAAAKMLPDFTDTNASGNTIHAKSNYFSIGTGVDYTYNQFNAGVSFDLVSYSKPKDDNKAKSDLLFLLWANYNLASQTKLFTSFGFANESEGKVASTDDQTTVSKLGFNFGIRQNF